MLDVNMVIVTNIQTELEKGNKKQTDLAEVIGVSGQAMSEIMNGTRAINAVELYKISEYLHVPMDTLIKMPEKNDGHKCDSYVDKPREDRGSKERNPACG